MMMMVHSTYIHLSMAFVGRGINDFPPKILCTLCNWFSICNAKHLDAPRARANRSHRVIYHRCAESACAVHAVFMGFSGATRALRL